MKGQSWANLGAVERRIPFRASVVVLAAAIGLLSRVVPAAESTVPLTAPVRMLSSRGQEKAAAMQSPAMAPQPERPQPTLPGGKLPQYQLDHRHRAIPAAGELHNPRVRLILALPIEPVLIEAHITIDGQPLHRVREQRIEQMIEQIAAGDDAAAAVPQRIRTYQQVSGEAPTPEEVRWLLTHWEDGPTLLMLNDNFQRFRANERPVFQVLDRDRDGTVGADELERAVQAFQECDLNRNDIVEYTELAEVANDPRQQKPEHAGPGKLLFLLPDETSASAVYRRLASHYAAQTTAIVPRLDKDANGSFNSAELAALRDGEPDLSFTVVFNSADAGQSRVSCTATSSAFAAAASGGQVAGTAITLPVAGSLLAVSAVQAEPSDQISVGAVQDGYPLLPLVDPNEDGRFTIRELRRLVELLRGIDRNQDDRLTVDEAQPTVRLCFGLGPHVHQELAEIRRLRSGPHKTTVAGPDWFIRMDRNQDNDLTRGEFPGTSEQFAQLDGDSDELISAEEASRFDQKSAGSAKDSPPNE